MKKISIVNYHMEMGGTEKALLALLNAIDYSEYEVHLYQLFPEGPLMDDIPKEVHLHQIDFKNSIYRGIVTNRRRNSEFKRTIFKVIKKLYIKTHGLDYDDGSFFDHVADKVIIDDPECDIFLDFAGYGYITSVIGAKIFKAPQKYTWVHDEKCDWLTRIKDHFKDYDTFFCVSEAVKKKVDDVFPEIAAKTEVFLNIIDVKSIISKAEEKVETLEGKYKLLTVGRIAKQKGWDVALETAGLLKQKGFEFVWYFIGDGADAPEMKKRITSMALENEVRLMGIKTNPYPYMKQCDLYVQPSRHEGYGIVLIEARALDRIIIASDIPCFREQIVDGKNGFLVELSPKKFAEKIIEVANDEKLREDIHQSLENEKINYTEEIKKLFG